MNSLFIRTQDNILVNLRDKDVSIRCNAEWHEYEYSVIAQGPHAGADEQFFEGKIIILHNGTKEECERYFDWLAGWVGADFYPENIPQTRREHPIEEPTPCPVCGGVEVHKWNCDTLIPF